MRHGSRNTYGEQEQEQKEEEDGEGGDRVRMIIAPPLPSRET